MLSRGRFAFAAPLCQVGRHFAWLNLNNRSLLSTGSAAPTRWTHSTVAGRKKIRFSRLMVTFFCAATFCTASMDETKFRNYRITWDVCYKVPGSPCTARSAIRQHRSNFSTSPDFYSTPDWGNDKPGSCCSLILERAAFFTCTPVHSGQEQD